MTELDWPTHLRAFRKLHGLTQQQLADHLPTATVRNIERWEAGDHTPQPFLHRALRDLGAQLVAGRRTSVAAKSSKAARARPGRNHGPAPKL